MLFKGTEQLSSLKLFYGQLSIVATIHVVIQQNIIMTKRKTFTFVVDLVTLALVMSHYKLCQ